MLTVGQNLAPGTPAIPDSAPINQYNTFQEVHKAPCSGLIHRLSTRVYTLSYISHDPAK